MVTYIWWYAYHSTPYVRHGKVTVPKQILHIFESKHFRKSWYRQPIWLCSLVQLYLQVVCWFMQVVFLSDELLITLGMGSIDWLKSSLFQMFQVFNIRSFTEKPNRMAICQMRQNKSFVKEKFCVPRYDVAKTRKNSNFLSSFLQTSLIIITIIIIIIYLVLFT